MTSGGSEWVIATSSGVTTGAILYAASSVRRTVKRLGREHDWLMATTAKNTEEIGKLVPVVEQQGNAIEHLMKEQRRPVQRR